MKKIKVILKLPISGREIAREYDEETSSLEVLESLAEEGILEEESRATGKRISFDERSFFLEANGKYLDSLEALSDSEIKDGDIITLSPVTGGGGNGPIDPVTLEYLVNLIKSYLDQQTAKEIVIETIKAYFVYKATVKVTVLGFRYGQKKQEPEEITASSSLKRRRRILDELEENHKLGQDFDVEEQPRKLRRPDRKRQIP